jgi:CRISPR-associated endonuclease/helicase Cas3
MIYAHTVPGKPETEWETLDDHAADVEALAGGWADAFGGGEWGQLAGRWHDLGKRQPAFQRYLRGLSPSTPHAWVGAYFAAVQKAEGTSPWPLVGAIASHHGALANVQADAANGIPPGATLSDAFKEWQRNAAPIKSLLPPAQPLPPLPAHLLRPGHSASRIELYTRFLFSALIDADRTATARFYARHEPALTAGDLQYDDIPTLAVRLDAAIDALPAKGSPAVIDLRRRVLAACRESPARPPGPFSLTVPTGGGKTLSAMSFALRHAQHNGLRRVIVVIPYTSIIEQSARVYGDVLNAPGRQNVLEHHSNIDEQSRLESDEHAEKLRKLAAENWDAPVIVTTTVQFFESLLAAHGSRCRKVHNIAKSVILLDEVQTLPPQFLETIVDVLSELTASYGCSVVLSTATPPALKHRDGVKRPGLKNVHEIMPDPQALANAARRVEIAWRIDRPTPYADLAAELRRERQVLAIVHRRDDAAALAEALSDDTLHLSAAMCPAHRLSVLAEIRRRLSTNKPCRLVSTQLIEAGVDVDFPVVYRALAGLDSIAQSAGRCDREGKLTDAAGKPAGRMVVFLAETDPPPGVPRKAMQSTQVLAALGALDPFDPGHSVRFFDELYGKTDLDARGIQTLRQKLAFAEVADRFKLIDNQTHAVVVPYVNAAAGIDGRARLAAFIKAPSRETARALQPVIVQIPKYRLDQLRAAGTIEPVDDFGRFDRLNEGHEAAYHKVYGLTANADPLLPAEASVF